MSVKYIDAVLDSDVSAGRFILLVLANNASEGGYCIPGAAYLAARTMTSKSTVFRALRKLEADELIQRKPRRRPNGSQTSNVYKINLILLRSRKLPESAEERVELASYFEDDGGDGDPPDE